MPSALTPATRARPAAASPVARLDAALAKHRRGVGRGHRVRTADGLVRLVDELGFCFAFTPEGSYPVPGCFDHLSTTDESKKWGWMWEWKDELSEAKRLYYGKLLVRKPTFVSLAALPLFYATFGRAGEADEYLDDVRAGRVSDLARRIIEHLAQNGETQTRRMRAQLGVSSDEGRRQYAKALEDLQRLMYIAHVRAVGDGRDDYNYTYDLFARRHVEAARAAEQLSSAEAMSLVIERLMAIAGGATERQIERLFDWEKERVVRSVDGLVSRGALSRIGDRVVLSAIAARLDSR